MKEQNLLLWSSEYKCSTLILLHSFLGFFYFQINKKKIPPIFPFFTLNNFSSQIHYEVFRTTLLFGTVE